jgi:hypothetical protein
MATEGKNLETSGELAWVLASKLTVDPRYQRPVFPAKVKKIQDGFDPDAFGVLYVSERADGSLVILDGQQRHAAVMGMPGWENDYLPAIVYTGLTVRQEAALFTLYNGIRTKPRPSDMYRAALVAGDPSVKAINVIVTDLGLVIGDGPGKTRVQSIASVRRIYDNVGGDVLRRVMTVATRAWAPGTREALSADILVSLATVVARHDPNDDRLVKVLMRAEPYDIIQKARVTLATFGKVGTGNAPMAGIIGGIIVRLYNNRLDADKKIKYDPEATGIAFWRSASLPPSSRQQRKAAVAASVTASKFFTDAQMQIFYEMRHKENKKWAEVHAAMQRASAKYRDAMLDMGTARNAVIRYAEIKDLPLVARRYNRKEVAAS